MGLLDNLDDNQRKMLMVGVPVVGLAAVYSLSKGSSSAPAEDEDEDRIPTSGVITGSNQSIGVGEISGFFNNVSDVISDLQADNAEWQTLQEERLAAIQAEGQATGSTTTNTSTTSSPTSSTSSYDRYERQVIEIYRALLGRNPDASGLAYWSDLLRRGKLTTGGVEWNIKQSAEYKRLHG